MMMMLCKMLRFLRPKPSFLLNGSSSSSWLISVPATHFFSTEAAPESFIDDGGKGSLKSSSSDVVVVDKVELTKTLLKRYGFTNTHLSKLLSQRPHIFTPLHPEKTLLPKLDFFRDTIGFSNTDLPRFICSNPSLLTSSLHNQIVPLYNFTKGLLLSDKIVLKTLKANPRLLTFSLQKTIDPNIAALREAGVPMKQILFMMRCFPTVLGSLCLGESIKRATEMGFDPNKLSFVEAIKVFTKMSKSTWDKKIEVYRRCGMTDAQILKAFRLFPICMALSERNIEQTMDFVVKKMGWQPVDLALRPTVLGCSLEKRTIPRCTLVRYLQGKGLVMKSVSFGRFLIMKEKDFVDEFVKKYEDDIPGLMDIYLGKTIIPPPLQEPTP